MQVTVFWLADVIAVAIYLVQASMYVTVIIALSFQQTVADPGFAKGGGGMASARSTSLNGGLGFSTPDPNQGTPSGVPWLGSGGSP